MKIALLIPIWNDWEAGLCLLRELEAELASTRPAFDFYFIDDGSTESAPNAVSAQILRIDENQGHQPALVAGLAHLLAKNIYGAFLLMDGDGEDRPADVSALLAAASAQPEKVVVASRRERSEKLPFRMGYRLYKFFFHLWAGQRIDFGNFLLLPAAAAEKLVRDPRSRIHLASTVLRLALPVIPVPVTRGPRYAGESKMNFFSLAWLGLGAISVFFETARRRIFFSVLGIAGIFSVLRNFYALPLWPANLMIASLFLFYGLLLYRRYTRSPELPILTGKN